MSALCQHCGVRNATQARGLCWRDYQDLAIRNLYPANRPGRLKGVAVVEPETMEEVEAMIAEQMRPENLPSWWSDDTGGIDWGYKTGAKSEASTRKAGKSLGNVGKRRKRK